MKCMIAQNLISSLCLCKALSVYYSMFFASLFTCNRNQTTTTTTVTISVEFPLRNYCAFCVFDNSACCMCVKCKPTLFPLHSKTLRGNCELCCFERFQIFYIVVARCRARVSWCFDSFHESEGKRKDFFVLMIQN